MLNDLLEAIAEAPDTQIDKAITDRIRPLIDAPLKVIVVNLKEILDDSARYSLASDFAMSAIDSAYKMAVEQYDK